MPTWLTAIFEILKFTIPALIMFWAVRSLFKEFLLGQQQMRMMEVRQKQVDSTLPLRLQAYERLALFCERITIPNLIRRVKTEGMQAGALRVALMMAIQQEYEHNLTQQIYVSEKLWEIIKLSRTDTLNVISSVAENVNPKDDAQKLVEALFAALESREGSPLLTAQIAIKKEAGLLFG
ncbi:MAG: hypothetical protein AAF960_23300 [Bacteroidota bacterium]